MSRLSELIAEITDEAFALSSSVDVRSLVPSLLENLDQDDILHLASAEAARRIKQYAEAARRAQMARFEGGQMRLGLDLPSAFAVGENRMVATAELRRTEVAALIKERKRQIVNDTARLRDLEAAELVAAPFWEKHPDWTLAQCFDAALLTLPEGV